MHKHWTTGRFSFNYYAHKQYNTMDADIVISACRKTVWNAQEEY